MSTPADYSAQERAAYVAWLLMEGNKLTTAEIARLTGFQTWQGAWLMMGRLSRILPIRSEEGVWSRISKPESPD